MAVLGGHRTDRVFSQIVVRVARLVTAVPIEGRKYFFNELNGLRGKWLSEWRKSHNLIFSAIYFETEIGGKRRIKQANGMREI